jgi:hypothetical protein
MLVKLLSVGAILFIIASEDIVHGSPGLWITRACAVALLISAATVWVLFVRPFPELRRKSALRRRRS